VPGTLHDVDFMVKDSKRFADSGGWGWAVFKYERPGGSRPEPRPTRHRRGTTPSVDSRANTIVKGERLRLHGLRESLKREAGAFIQRRRT